MARSHWDIVVGDILSSTAEGGSYEVLSGAGQFHSPLYGLHPIQGENRFFYNGDITLVNTRFYARIKNTTVESQRHRAFFFFRWNQKEPVLNGYQLDLRAGSSTTWVTFMTRWKTGSNTTLSSPYSVTTGAGTLTDWQEFRATVRTESGIPVFRVDWWNGSAWQMFYEYYDNNANKILTGGYTGFGFREQYDGNFYIDDINLTKFTEV